MADAVRPDDVTAETFAARLTPVTPDGPALASDPGRA